MKASVEVYGGRFAGSFDLTPSDGACLDHDAEVEFKVKAIVKKVTLEDVRSGELRLFYVIRPQEVTLDPRFTMGEVNMVEIGGVVMTQEQFDAARYPLLHDPEDDDFEHDPDWDDEDLPVVATAQATRSGDPGHNQYTRVPEDNIEQPQGKPVSTVQPHSNVAGSSQAERDAALHDFLYGGN